MKKNEYISPKMEIVEIKMEYLMQSGSSQGAGDGRNPGGNVGGEYEVPDE